MKKFFVRGLSIFLAVLVLCSCITVPALAADSSKTGTFWDAAARGISPLYAFISAYLEDGKTPETATDADWRHAYGGFGGEGSSSAGSGYVGEVNEKLGTIEIGSTGYKLFLWPDWLRHSDDFDTLQAVSYGQNWLEFVVPRFDGAGSGSRKTYYAIDIPSEFLWNGLSMLNTARSYITYVPGMYSVRDDSVTASDSSFTFMLGDSLNYFSGKNDDGTVCSFSTRKSVYAAGWGLTADLTSFDGYRFKYKFESASSIGVRLDITSPSYLYVEPVEWAINDFTALVGGADSRTGSFAGSYGYYGDDGKLIVGESVKLVDETNNTVYNPVTNTTSTVTDWTYDYSDRSYNVTTTTGDAITVAYGDENVTIKEDDVTYNVYYVIDGGGSGGIDPDNPDPPATCAHAYVGTVVTEPTCLTAGSRSLTCSKCNHTKTEKIPATGHIWVVERTVQTSYDDQGVMVQQGYTIYKCSVCGEQYKDADGAGPPGGTGGTDDKESFWDKVKNFFGALTGGVFDLITDLIGKILDGLTALINKITEKLGVIVDAALKIFNEIPKLFQGFIDFLTAGFAFFPPEIVMIIEFGLLAIIVVAIIKIFL